MQSITTRFPGQRVGMDIVGPFFRSRKGNTYILVMVDHFTKWAEAYPIPNQEALTIAKVIVDQWVPNQGVPYMLHSDQGPNFESNLIRELCKLMDINKTRTTPYHPQGNGQTERTNKTLVTLLRAFTDMAKTDIWDEMLPRVMIAYRASVQESTGVTPNLLNFGRELRLSIDASFPHSKPVSSSSATFLGNLLDATHTAQQLARKKLGVAQEKQKDYYDSHGHGSSYQIGDAVYLHKPPISQRPLGKLTRPWSGPFVVIGTSSTGVYEIRWQHDLNAAPFRVHFNRLKPWATIADASPSYPNPPPLPPLEIPPAIVEVEIPAEGGYGVSITDL